MRSVSVCACRRLALLVLLILVSAAPAFADDPPAVFEPPQGHIRIPPTNTSYDDPSIDPPQGRIQIPPTATPQGIGIPPTDAWQSEEPSLWDVFVGWLHGHIGIPPG